MHKMEIVVAERNDSEVLASIVSESNKDVAELLALNINNAPKHPSFCTAEWIESDFDRGQEYFLSTENGISTGCVAFEHPESDTAYLNRLSVLPKFRNRGLGSALVKHIVDYAKEKRIKNISIGIISEHNQLREWYLKLGFIEGALQKFDHLPFNVLYMKYKI
ncbi:MAG: ribosomal protein S18 acetylase RimI-like enzyme [Desulforhopalus sp.]|jgi:ribosomal protein S18 acetylase RimI-like enzyme